ncbi:DUF1877 family protein [Micromonospora haikouensis]|uniref:DUF1877 family protein n=1 Tax=Micromonospora haikouensis TaxID=686309 RepID=UPI003D7372D7
MSVLGEFVRLDPELLGQVRSTPTQAYDRLSRFSESSRLDLGQAWQRLAALMDAARFPLNPVSAGSVFPDECTSWGAEADSRVLTAKEVAQASAHLNQAPFEVLMPHLRQVVEGEEGILVNLDPGSPHYLEPLSPEEAAKWRVPDERLRTIAPFLADRYEALVAFFDVAAKSAQCVVFWAA